MPTLTTGQINTARAYLGVDYAHSDIVGYYTYLASQGVSYGDFAKAVVQNNTAEGKIANAYAASVALGHGVDFSVGSDAWKLVVFNVALEDIDARDANAGVDLTFEDYDAIHTAAFAVADLPAEAWTAHTPLTNAAQLDPLVAEANWNSLLNGSTSSIAVLTGGLQLSLSAFAVDASQSPVGILRDNAAAAKWLANIAVAMYVVGDSAVDDLIPTSNTQFWNDFDDLKEFFSDHFGANDPVVPTWMEGYLDPAIDPTFALPSAISAGIQTAFNNAIRAGSPLVIDLSSGHTGVTLTTWNATATETFFDLNSNGFAVQTAWVSGTTGLLARDLNSNGAIDSSTELFGSPTVDGFAKLGLLDSNQDLRIDNNDDAWSTLVVWKDTNGDAVTQSGELYSLSSLNIANIDLAGLTASTSTISGNPISHTSKVTFVGGATATIADAWFIHDNTNAIYASDYTLDMQTLFLPTLRGFGLLPSLTVAMSLDSDLKDLVSDFTANFTLDSLTDAAAFQADIEEILFTWAGVEGVDPDSRGDFFDARHLGVLEKLVGAEFFQIQQQTPNPTPGAVVTLTPAYQATLDYVISSLLVQLAGAELFSNEVTYNAASGSIEGDATLSSDALDYLVSVAPAAGSSNNAFWTLVIRLIDSVRDIDNLTMTETNLLQDALAETDVALSINTIRNWIDPTFLAYNYIAGTSGNDTLNGGSDKDSISGAAGHDTIHGNGGNDIITGNAGNNILYGDAGNDVIWGGNDSESLYGGDGDDEIHADQGANTVNGGIGSNILYAGSNGDTYIYAGGQDLIIDAGGTDHIEMPSGIVSGDLSFLRVSGQGSTTSFNDLLILINGFAAIQIQNNYSGLSLGSGNIESVVFADTSTLNLTTVTNPQVRLTNGNDTAGYTSSNAFTIYGLNGDDSINLSGGSGNDTVDGGAGNDTLTLGSGNDTYIASTGLDTFYDYGGTDTIVVPAGFDIGDITFYRINNTSGPTNNLGILINGLGEIAVTNQFANNTYVIENLYFLADSSTVSLAAQSITTLGTAGNDNLYPPNYGASTADIMDGREGNDYLAGGAGNDTYIFSAGQDRIYDDGGNDTISIRAIYDTSDITVAWNVSAINPTDNRGIILTDSDGNTVIVQNQSYTTSYGVEHIAFSGGTTWHLSSMELSTYGTSGNDTLDGHNVGDASSADTIYGYGGADTVNGGNGVDLIYGGDGDDNLAGNAGNDELYGGNGADTIYAASNDGSDIMHGDGGADTLRGADHSILYGDDGNDTLYNIAGSPYAAGTLVTMYGGNGADTLNSGNGTNVMNGGAGADTLVGGSSIDIFTFDAATAFDAVDTVQNFYKAGGDKIDISDVLDGLYDPMSDVITDFVQISTNGSHSEVRVDVTGSASFGAGTQIATIQWVTGLTDEAALVTSGNLIAA